MPSRSYILHRGCFLSRGGRATRTVDERARRSTSLGCRRGRGWLPLRRGDRDGLGEDEGGDGDHRLQADELLQARSTSKDFETMSTYRFQEAEGRWLTASSRSARRFSSGCALSRSPDKPERSSRRTSRSSNSSWRRKPSGINQASDPILIQQYNTGVKRARPGGRVRYRHSARDR